LKFLEFICLKLEKIPRKAVIKKLFLEKYESELSPPNLLLYSIIYIHNLWVMIYDSLNSIQFNVIYISSFIS
jgi:hypothetical protein